MHVLFIIPPYNTAASWGIQGRMKEGVLPPMGVGYLASALEENGHSASLIDAAALGWRLQMVLDKVAQYNPDVVGISCLSTYYGLAHDLAAGIKDKYPGIPVVMGGPYVTFSHRAVLEACPHIDVAFLGEAEISFSSYINRLAAEKPYDDIPGILRWASNLDNWSRCIR